MNSLDKINKTILDIQINENRTHVTYCRKLLESEFPDKGITSLEDLIIYMKQINILYGDLDVAVSCSDVILKRALVKLKINSLDIINEVTIDVIYNKLVPSLKNIVELMKIKNLQSASLIRNTKIEHFSDIIHQKMNALHMRRINILDETKVKVSYCYNYSQNKVTPSKKEIDNLHDLLKEMIIKKITMLECEKRLPDNTYYLLDYNEPEIYHENKEMYDVMKKLNIYFIEYDSNKVKAIYY